MDWSDLRIFLAIVRAGSFGAAARRLGLSHPTVARRLGALEAACGRRLLQRTAEGLIATEEGASIIALAEQVEDATLAIERRLAGTDGALEGTLRITASDWFASWILPPVIEAFAARHPGVTIELLTGARLFSLAHREADLAFRVVPFDEADIVQRHLMTLRFGAYVASGAQDRPGGPRIIEDTPTEMHPDVGWLSRHFDGARVVLRSNSRTVQVSACAQGVGMALLPTAIAAHLPGLRAVALADTPPERTVWMGYHRDLRTLGRLRAFVELAIEHLAGR